MEIWRDIKGYEGIYQVSNYGRVKSLERCIKNNKYNGSYTKKECFRTLVFDGKGKYLLVGLWKKNKGRKYLVHRLVAETFIPNPKNKKNVNHKNCIQHDNRVYNLEWATSSENRQHCHDNNLHPGNGLKRKIVCSNGMTFDSSYQAADWINLSIFKSKRKVHSIAGKIRWCANGYAKTAYKLKWEFVN